MAENSTVFITGGTGYIGSHCIVELLIEGYDVVTIDNLTNSRSGALSRVQEITGKKVIFYQCDLLDGKAINQIFSKHKIDFVIHFAAMKAVGESMQFPLIYYKNNVIGTINLVEAMKDHGVFKLVFSSSCTVYGNPDYLPITEKHRTGNVTNVYGRTKYLIEEMLKDLSYAEPRWNIIALRYFNPLGAHPSGRLGEDPTKAFANIMPYIGQVALGKKPKLQIFGCDYATADGTGMRDYIHVMDLATGHVAALAKLKKDNDLKFKAYNLGTGRCVTVLQLVKMFEVVNDIDIPCKSMPRRQGDIVCIYANASLAEKELKWKSKYTLKDMCRDFWRWQVQNPNGYSDVDSYPETELHIPEFLPEKGYDKIDTRSANGDKCIKDDTSELVDSSNVISNNIKDDASELVDSSKGISNNMKDDASELVDSAQEISNMKDDSSELVDSAQEISNMKDDASELVDSAKGISNMKNDASELVDSVKGISNMKNDASELVDSAKEIANNINDDASELVDSAQGISNIKDDASELVDSAKGITTNIKNDASELVDSSN